MQLPQDDPRLRQLQLRHELIGRGHSDRSLALAVRRGDLARPRRGAYFDGPTWWAMSEEERYAVRCRAVFAQANTGVILSHVSALPFADAPLWGFDLSDIHVTREDGLAGRKERGVRRHCGKLLAGDVTETHRLLVMTPLRAALEVTMLGCTEASLVVVNHFLHRGDFDLETLRARYDDSMGRWPNSLPTDLVLRLANPRVESVAESRTEFFCFQRGLPRPIAQYEIHDAGALIARLDFAFPDLGFWIEFDGRVKYERHLRPGESPTDAVLREKRREQLVAELTGWRCLRITWADLANPDALERRIRRLIESIAKDRSRRRAS
ncbi:hypothetical protein KVF89_17885 [Nocardioides carbamazepini]|uniref:hypothetical protein n=1 Tax=Nocardioides carbamazepini TaxID=2854259 RepID=UPI00214A07A2|nr:hypothetical protein [Nocardioides carbamazepini]MCR1784418.1 hypothetical protein [Nocardioides carbamazepini]